jgi:methyltransferase (TIGR00027 family)
MLSDIPAILRAMHQAVDDEPKIVVDPVAPKLIDMTSLDERWLAPILNHPFAPQWRAGFLIRCRYAEDCLREAVERGITQYLILGAGLDTFSYRQPAWAEALRVFEMDHPATQGFKRERLAAAHLFPACRSFPD